jgi:hypothetical protein
METSSIHSHQLCRISGGSTPVRHRERTPSKVPSKHETDRCHAPRRSPDHGLRYRNDDARFPERSENAQGIDRRTVVTRRLVQARRCFVTMQNGGRESEPKAICRRGDPDIEIVKHVQDHDTDDYHGLLSAAQLVAEMP